MTNIILCGKANDTSISCTLLPTLSKYGGVQYYSSDRITLLGEDKMKFLVYDCEKLPQIELDSGIILFKNSFNASEQIKIPNGFLCILEMKNVHVNDQCIGCCRQRYDSRSGAILTS